MGRPAPTSKPTGATVNDARAEHRARQLATKIKTAALGLDEHGAARIVGSVEHELAKIARIADPRERIVRLLDLADEIRPHVPEGTQRWVLPQPVNHRDHLRTD